jgi:hypothetical protein
MAGLKRAFFTRPTPLPRPGFEVFSKWMRNIHDAFEFGLRARSDHLYCRQVAEPYAAPYDEETLGGNVTFESLSAIFEESLASKHLTTQRRQELEMGYWIEHKVE